MTGPTAPNAETFRTGEAAALARVNQEPLRYYERRGLLDVPERTLGRRSPTYKSSPQRCAPPSTQDATT